MIFQKLLANKEYTVILRTETFLYLKTSNNHYVFYSQNFELKCFHIESFKEISQLQFYEFNYSMSNQELIALTNSSLTVKLDFEEEPLSSILGKCFRIENLNKVPLESIINEESIRFVEDFYFIIPTIKWKFSIEEQYYYLIPNTSFCIKFNSNTFFKYGLDNHRISRGTKNNIFFLNPYTMFDYYQHELPNLERDSIYIGYPTDKSIPAQIVVRGTKKELISSFKIFCDRHSLPFTINHHTITLHCIHKNFAGFYNEFHKNLFEALKNDFTYFQQKTSFNVNYEQSIKIMPQKLNNHIYPIIEFTNDTSRLQIVIEFLLNELFKETTQINITTYSPIPSYSYEQVGYEEIPDSAIINSDY